MPVIHIKAGAARAVGTCFAISNDGLCLTARHVIEEAWPEAFRAGSTDLDRDGQLYALYCSDEPHPDNPDQRVGGLLPVVSTHFYDQLDIAALQLEVPRRTDSGDLIRIPANKLGLAPPSAGEACFAFGYHSMKWRGSGPDYGVEQEFYASRGTIEEIHLPQRDAVMAPFPCFRTSARYDGGMSGGPVLGMDGLVRGVVCSSVSGVRDSEGYVSYASLIGPAALLQVTRLDDAGAAGVYFIYDLVERKVVRADSDRVHFERNSSELIMTIGGGVISSRIGG